MKVEFINKENILDEFRTAGWLAQVSTDSNSDPIKTAMTCIKSGHGTPTRSIRFLFEISEVSRVLSHEFVRHEVGVIKVQRSQRYVKEDGFGYTTPAGIANKRVLVDIPVIRKSFPDGDPVQVESERSWLSFDRFQSIVKQMYDGLVSQGVKPEDARFVLSNATHTKLRVAFDWEGLVNFCHRRCCNRAQWEIHDLAVEIRRQVVDALPDLKFYLGPNCFTAGKCLETKSCGSIFNLKTKEV